MIDALADVNFEGECVQCSENKTEFARAFARFEIDDPFPAHVHSRSKCGLSESLTAPALSYEETDFSWGANDHMSLTGDIAQMSPYGYMPAHMVLLKISSHPWPRAHDTRLS